MSDTNDQQPIEILGIAGSLRGGSYNRALIRTAGELAPAGVRWRSYDALGDVPPYDQDQDTDSPPPAVADLRRAIGRADGVLFATPEYNHSIPGVLKNAVDWASRPHGESVLVDKPVAVVGASPSRFGAQWAQEDLRRVLEATQSKVLEVELPVSKANERIEDGALVDEEIRRRLGAVVSELVAVAAPAWAEEGDERCRRLAAAC